MENEPTTSIWLRMSHNDRDKVVEGHWGLLLKAKPKKESKEKKSRKS